MLLTRSGWLAAVLGGVLVLAGRILGQLEFLMLGAGVLGLVVFALLRVWTTRLKLAVARQVTPSRVHAGSPARVDLRILNQSRRPTPVLRLNDAVSGTRGANLLLAPLASGARTKVAYRLPTDRRGRLEIGPLRIRLTDPFGLASIDLEGAGRTEITVFPRVDRILPIHRTTGQDPHSDAVHANSLGRSGDEFYALRQYQVGDSLRRVHWPSSARHDDLMVRQDELPWQGRVTVMLDINNLAYGSNADSFERAVSAAASIIAAAIGRGDHARLITTAGHDHGMATTRSELDRHLEALALIEPTTSTSFEHLGEVLRGGLDGALAMITAGAGSSLDPGGRLRARFGSVTTVVFPGPNGTLPSAASPDVIPVPPGTPFDQVWAQARRGRRRGARVG
ncbi:MAG: DUF58 domain-containing protein [Actinomycetia bacterium]|nr:DUF58 domain-containing protein [Actinomycetes bacterium]